VSRPRLLVIASTFPVGAQDGTPAFVRDLALEASREFDTEVLVPRVPGGERHEAAGALSVRRFGYFPRRYEDLADGAILENLRARRVRWLQVPAFVLAEAFALRRAVRRHRPDVLHVHWMIPQGIAALVVVLLGLAVVGALLTFAGQQVATGAADLADSTVQGLEEIRAWLRDGPVNASNSQINGWIQGAQEAIQTNSQNGAIGQVTEVGSAVGHVVAGVIDWLSVFRQWAWARARGRKPFQ